MNSVDIRSVRSIESVIVVRAGELYGGVTPKLQGPAQAIIENHYVRAYEDVFCSLLNLTEFMFNH